MTVPQPTGTHVMLVPASKRKRFKKFPKTLMISAVGKCHHDFELRIPVPYSVYGRPVTEEGWRQIEETIKNQQDAYKNYDCPLCTSTENLKSTRERDEKFAEIMRVTPLPHMEGTVKQVEYAEGVRSNIMWQGVNRYARETLRSFHTPNIAERLMLDALKGFSAENGIVRSYKDTSNVGVSLANDLAPYSVLFWSHRKQRLSPQEAVAITLVVRDIWTENTALFNELRPKAWIASKGRPYSPSPVIDTHIITAAVVTSRLCDWTSLAAAEMAYKILSTNSSSQYRNLITLIQNREESSWEDILEEATIWEVLS